MPVDPSQFATYFNNPDYFAGAMTQLRNYANNSGYILDGDPDKDSGKTMGVFIGLSDAGTPGTFQNWAQQYFNNGFSAIEVKPILDAYVQNTVLARAINKVNAQVNTNAADVNKALSNIPQTQEQAPPPESSFPWGWVALGVAGLGTVTYFAVKKSKKSKKK